MIMGRKTFQAIGRALDGRDTIVVTRDAGFQAEGVHVAGSLADAFRIAIGRAAARGTDEIIIAGGGEIYRAALPFAHIVQLDEIDATPAGDTSFPQLDARDWRELAREPMSAHAKDEFAAQAVTYERVTPARPLTGA